MIFTITDTVVTLTHNEKKQIYQCYKFGPYVRNDHLLKDYQRPMVTGQRVIDTLFPIARGGIAAIPGPFGSGKLVVQHQLAK